MTPRLPRRVPAAARYSHRFAHVAIAKEQAQAVAAYLIGNIEVKDPVAYEEYRRGVAATLAAHGGRFLVRGGAARALEGTVLPKRIVVIEFPTRAAAEAWYSSAEYAPLLALRKRASIGDLMLADGV